MGINAPSPLVVVISRRLRALGVRDSHTNDDSEDNGDDSADDQPHL